MRPIEVQIAKSDVELTIRVHNYGPAIDPGFMPFLFDPFQRDKPCSGSSGLGLGLYISQRVVAAHGGEIRSRASPRDMIDVSDQSEPCVLIVDDEADAREMLGELIEMAGCSALLAANGAEGLAILANHRPCMIILDLMMPVMTGAEMVEELQRKPQLASVPVLISTSSPPHAPAGLPVLAKPIDIDALWNWMRQVCACASGAPRVTA